jgi:phage terminase small subunit
MARETNKLSRRQELFVAEYLKTSNAAKATIAAGYSVKGANVQGSRLLANVNIRDRVQQKTTKTLDKLGISAEYILGSAKIVHDKAIEELNSKGFNSAVAAIAIKAQELLGRNQALWTERLEHNHTLTLEHLVCGADE